MFFRIKGKTAVFEFLRIVCMRLFKIDLQSFQQRKHFYSWRFHQIWRYQ